MYSLTPTSVCGRRLGFKCEPSARSYAILSISSNPTVSVFPSEPISRLNGLCRIGAARSRGGRSTFKHGTRLPHVPPGNDTRNGSPRQCFGCLLSSSQALSFTPDQIHTLMQDARQAGPRGALRPHTLSTLIGLLASTGLRVGEALRLTVTDVVLESEPPCLHIRETKFYKSRLVPLHPSTAINCAIMSLSERLCITMGCQTCSLSPSTVDRCIAVPSGVGYHAVSHFRHGVNGRRASPESQRIAPLLCG